MKTADLCADGHHTTMCSYCGACAHEVRACCSRCTTKECPGRCRCTQPPAATDPGPETNTQSATRKPRARRTALTLAHHATGTTAALLILTTTIALTTLLVSDLAPDITGHHRTAWTAALAIAMYFPADWAVTTALTPLVNRIQTLRDREDQR